MPSLSLQRRGPRIDVVLAAALAACVVFFTVTSHAERDRVRIRADSAFHGVSLTGRGGTWGSGVEISGSLRDELGQPVGGASVVVPLPANSQGGASPCRAGDAVRAEGSAVVTATDVLGLFCVRLPPGAPLTGQKVRFGGDRYYGPAEAPLPEPSSHRRLELSFDARELDVSLDESSFVVDVTTRLVDGVGTGSTVRLVLSHQPDAGKAEEAEVSAADVQAGGRARFDVETRALGAPGIGKLVVRFAGSSVLSSASAAALLTRTATARLALAGTVTPGDPHEGVAIPLGVSSSVGAVTDGWVIAAFGGQPAGAAEVKGGAARLLATFVPQRGRPAALTLRYAPGQGGFVPGDVLVVDVPLKGPSPWTWIPWMLVAAAIGYWVVRAWRRPPRTVRRDDRPSRPPVPGHATIDLLEAGAANAGWHGRVIDAHDGTVVAGARVSLLVPVFDGEGVAASHTTQADGAFSLPHVEAARAQGAQLVVTAPFHTTLSGPAPRDGLITIALVSRRRTLVDRLVSWAKRAGRPWSPSRGKAEPTPFEVAEIARRRRQGDVAAWAIAVGEAAFGHAPPDERREQELTAREPPVPGSKGER